MFFSKLATNLTEGDWKVQKKTKIQLAWNGVILGALLILALVIMLSIIWPPTMFIAAGVSGAILLITCGVYLADNS